MPSDETKHSLFTLCVERLTCKYVSDDVIMTKIVSNIYIQYIIDFSTSCYILPKHSCFVYTCIYVERLPSKYISSE